MSDIREALMEVIANRTAPNAADAILSRFDVTERGPVARGLAQSAAGDVLDLGDFTQYADLDVQAGIAGVLREHGWVYTQPVTASRCVCGKRPDDMAEHQAIAVSDWLRGRADMIPSEYAVAPPTVKPSVEALADALAAEGIDCEPGELDLTPMAERLLAMLPGRTETEVKVAALREAASAAVTDDEGIPWDHDHDRATVSAWLEDRADSLARGEGA